MEWISLVLNGVLTLVVAIGGWLMNSHNDKLKAQDGKIERIEQRINNLPDVYARRDDLAEVKQTLVRIEEKLDRSLFNHG